MNVTASTSSPASNFTLLDYLSPTEFPKITVPLATIPHSHLRSKGWILPLSSADPTLKEITTFLHNASAEGDIEECLRAFVDCVRKDADDVEKTHLIIYLRLKRECEEKDYLRWHQDGLFWKRGGDKEEYGKPVYKYGCVLTGAETPFLLPNEAEMEILRKGAEDEIAVHKAVDGESDTTENQRTRLNQIMEIRRNTTRALSTTTDRISAKPGQCAKWIIGDTERGTWHSEPYDESCRIFIGCIPVTEEQANTCFPFVLQEQGA